MNNADAIIDHLTRNYRDAEYIELEVRYKFLLEEVLKTEKAFKEDWITNHRCECKFSEYQDSCIHIKKAMHKNKDMKINREALWDISMKMFHKTNNGLYFLTAQQFNDKFKKN